MFAVTRSIMLACETRSLQIILNITLLETVKPIGLISLSISLKEICSE